MSLRSACCTPSPDTSRVIEGLSDLRLILSTRPVDSAVILLRQATERGGLPVTATGNLSRCAPRCRRDRRVGGARGRNHSPSFDQPADFLRDTQVRQWLDGGTSHVRRDPPALPGSMIPVAASFGLWGHLCWAVVWAAGKVKHDIRRHHPWPQCARRKPVGSMYGRAATCGPQTQESTPWTPCGALKASGWGGLRGIPSSLRGDCTPSAGRQGWRHEDHQRRTNWRRPRSA